MKKYLKETIFSVLGINAKYWVPQRRERIYIVCFDRKIFDDRSLRNFSFPKNFAVERILDDVLEKPDKKYILSDKYGTI